ncbi:MAG: host attachment protein [Gammaproteobacteria bacterium]
MAKTWIIVAESSRARIFVTENPRAPMDEVEDIVHPEGRLRAQDLRSDRPTRVFDSKGQGRHAVESEVEPRHQEAINFARRIADRIEDARVSGGFDELVLVAPPAFLGLLRDNLSANAMKRVVQSINKNLAQLDEAQIREHVFG